MLLADIPSAVWRDRRGLIDASSYEGLSSVSTASEWVSFARDADRNRDGLIARQRRWLERQAMPIEPADVYARFAQLFESAERVEVSSSRAAVPNADPQLAG
jgi:hypothetical protein